MISTTSIAISAAEPPLDLRLVKTSCPGVSITKIPGTLFSSFPIFSYSGPQIFFIVSSGRKLAPICCVIPPASRSCTPVPRILSSIDVLPEST